MTHSQNSYRFYPTGTSSILWPGRGRQYLCPFFPHILCSTNKIYSDTAEHLRISSSGTCHFVFTPQQSFQDLCVRVPRSTEKRSQRFLLTHNTQEVHSILNTRTTRDLVFLQFHFLLPSKQNLFKDTRRF